MLRKTIILYIIPLPVLGGTQSHLSHLIKGFFSQYEIHLAIGQKGPLTDIAEKLNVQVHILPHLVREVDLKADFKAIQEFATLIKHIQPDLIHAHNSKAGLVGRIAGKLCGVPTIYTAHGWQFTQGTPFVHRVLSYINEKIGAFLSQKIICVAESDRQLALRAKISSVQKLVTIHLGIEDTNTVIANPTYQPPKVIMVARFDKQKDHFTLLQAVSQISYLHYSVDLIGNGPLLEECKLAAHDLGIEDKVNFLGSRFDVPQRLSAAQLFVLSTNYEGLPISILEAMRSGLPVIATDVDGISEEVQAGQTGLLVPRQDIKSLANALKQLLSSPNIRQEMGRAGREIFEREFSIERMLCETQSIYEGVLKT